MSLTRRQFIARLAAAPGLLAVPRADRVALMRGRAAADTTTRMALGFSEPHLEWRGESSATTALRTAAQAVRRPISIVARPTRFDWNAAGGVLRERFRDLRRHFVFEYYPWYGTNPWRHWSDADRTPPIDIASNYMPLLGPYDSSSAAVLERHAQWIAESGAGAVNISWWGPGSDTDRAVPLVMDVMRAHDIHVTFHLEPYTDRRTEVYVRDVLYLLEEYGRKRRWDCFLLLTDAAGRTGPVIKSFRTILPATVKNCLGQTFPVPDYRPDSAWRQATDTLRETLRSDFDSVTLLADSLDFGRTPASGFDGIAIYDNYLEPTLWPDFASGASGRGLVFSFNSNPGFDGLVPRNPAPDPCYRPPRVEPDSDEADFRTVSGRVTAARASRNRIVESLETTVRLQMDPSLANLGKGFFLVYLNSFNEWHEGHQFEPMKNLSDLRPAERAIGYHNAVLGSYRLQALSARLHQLVG